jgi:hypothetical protein
VSDGERGKDMAVVIKESSQDEIYLPGWLLNMLSLSEGNIVRATVQENKLQLEQIDRFLSLRGVFANDEGFDRAMTAIDKAWDSWPLPDSV